MLHFRHMDTGNSPEVKRIAIVGPECTGKTALARFLAQHFQTAWVPEFARSYIETLNRPYEKHDLVTIARGQILVENERAVKAKKVLICDTNLIVIKIWSEFNYQHCDPEILKEVSNQKYDLHLLTYIDIPWEDDPQREHPDQREQLYELYKNELLNSNARFVEIKGEEHERGVTAIKSIEEIL
jgi:NadR type nicotinamide-nucleotide adenylyltransferase